MDLCRVLSTFMIVTILTSAQDILLTNFEPEIVTLSDTKDNKWTGWINQGWWSQSLELGKRKSFMACQDHVWLRTPYIRRQEANEIFVQLEYRNMKENENSNKTKILLTEINSPDELRKEIPENDFINSSTVKNNQNPDNNSAVKHTYTGRKEDAFPISEQIVHFPLTRKRQGFTIAFESKNSCLLLIRVHIFYKVCPSLQDKFAEFPRTIAGASDLHVEGTCLPGAGQLPGRLPPSRICNRDGYWKRDPARTLLHDECQCLPGFTATSDSISTSCRICSQGEYKYTLGPFECSKCPQNSVSSKVPYAFVEEEVKQLQHITQIPGYVSCSCLPRFYRHVLMDQLTEPCTSLPSSPRNIDADITNTAKVLIKWNEPKNFGGRRNIIDYSVECQVVEKNLKRPCGKRIRIANHSQNTNYNEVIVYGLSPKEMYQFSVIALNELSSLANVDLDYSTATINVQIPEPVPVEVYNLRYTKIKRDPMHNLTSGLGGAICVSWELPNEAFDQPPIVISEYEVNVLIENGTDSTGRVMILDLYVHFLDRNYDLYSLPYNRTIIVKVRPKIKNGPWGSFKTLPEVILHPEDDNLLSPIELQAWLGRTSGPRGPFSTNNVYHKNHHLLVILFSVGFVVFCLFIFCAIFSLYKRFHKSDKSLINKIPQGNPMIINSNCQLMKNNNSSLLSHRDEQRASNNSSVMRINCENPTQKRSFNTSSLNSSTNHSKVSDKNSLQELIMQNKTSIAMEEKKYLIDNVTKKKNSISTPYISQSPNGGLNPTTVSNNNSQKNPRNNSDSGNSSRDINCQIENMDDDMPIYNESMMYEEAQVNYGKEIDPACVFNSVVIGSGEFGEVCRAFMKTVGMDQPKVVAIKTLKATASRKEREDFLAEALIISQLRHPHIVSLEGVVTLTDPIMIIFEYMENHSLDKYLRANRGNIFVVKLVKILSGIASAMSYIVDSGYIHRDLAARNILVNDQMICKVSDFGLSRKIDFEDSDDASYTTMGGKIPVRWTAPEAITHRKFSASSDVWSFGILSWEVMSMGERPYWNWSNQAVLEAVDSGYRLPLPNGCPLFIHQLMLKCWLANRLDRPTFCDIEMQLDNFLQLGANIDANMNSPLQMYHPSMQQQNNTSNLFNTTNITGNRLLQPQLPLFQPHYQTLDNHDLLSGSSNTTGYHFDAWVIKTGLQGLSSRLKACGINSVEGLQAVNFDDVQRLGLFTNRELQMLLYHVSQTTPGNPHKHLSSLPISSNLPNFPSLLSDGT